MPCSALEVPSDNDIRDKARPLQMKMNLRALLVTVICLTVYKTVSTSQDVMRTLSIKYINGLDVCKSELNLPDSVDLEFANFWKAEYKLKDRLTGCAIVCLSTKLNLLEPDGSLHHGNAAEFAKKHGADDAMAQQLIDLLHECEKLTPDKSDYCQNAIEISNCFKTEIHKLSWAPDVELLVGEVLAEI